MKQAITRVWFWLVAILSIVSGMSAAESEQYAIHRKAQLSGHDKPIRIVRLSSDGKWLASGEEAPAGSRRLFLWDVSNLERPPAQPLKQFDRVRCAVFSPDSKTLAVGLLGGSVRLISLDNLGQSVDLVDATPVTPKSQPRDCMNLAFSPDGAYLACICKDRHLRLWDIAKQALVRRWRPHRADLLNVVFSPSGDSLATCSFDNTAAIWNLRGGLLHRLRHPKWVTSVQYVAGGSRLVTGSNDQSLRVYDTANGKLVQQFTAHAATIWHMRPIAPDYLMVTGSSDRTLRLWNTRTNQQKAIAHADGNVTMHLDVDTKRNIIATGYGGGNQRQYAGDYRVHLWEISKGPVEATTKTHANEPGVTTVTPDANPQQLSSSDAPLRYRWNEDVAPEYEFTLTAKFPSMESSAMGRFSFAVAKTSTLELSAIGRPVSKLGPGPFHTLTFDGYFDYLRMPEHVTPESARPAMRQAVNGEVVVNDYGKVLLRTGAAQMPFSLGWINELAVEPLPDAARKSWDSERTVQLNLEGFFTTKREGSVRGREAREVVAYRKLSEKDGIATVEKVYRLHAEQVGFNPPLTVAYQGNGLFDKRTGIWRQMTMKGTCTGRYNADNVEFTLSYRNVASRTRSTLPINTIEGRYSPKTVAQLASKVGSTRAQGIHALQKEVSHLFADRRVRSPKVAALKHANATKLLLKAAEDHDPRVRKAVLSGWRRLLVPIDYLTEESQASLDAIASHLAEKLGSFRQEERDVAVAVLEEMGPRGELRFPN